MSELGKVDSYDELRPANIYDVAANETWLEDQSAQGWHLTGFSGWSGLFARGEPKHCRYRMQPLPKKEKAPDPALMEAYQEMGWTYVATLPGTFHVWRCDDPGAPELDTDPVVQGLGYGYLRRRMVRDRVWNLLALAAAIYFLSAVTWASDTPRLATLEEFAQNLRSGRSLDEKREALLHTMACKAAIKGGWTSDPAELKVLVEKVQSGEVRYCPHGRPVVVKVTKYELEKLFKRA